MTMAAAGEQAMASEPQPEATVLGYIYSYNCGVETEAAPKNQVCNI